MKHTTRIITQHTVELSQQELREIICKAIVAPAESAQIYNVDAGIRIEWEVVKEQLMPIAFAEEAAAAA